MTHESQAAALHPERAASASLCPACGRVEPERFLRTPELPVKSIALWKTRAAAVACPRGTIDLAFCPACGAISNQAFDPNRVRYDDSYDNSLHFSPTFQK